MTFCGVKFDPEQDMPDLRGKVILVTGGNTGLGLESIRQLAQHNPAHIYMGARSRAKAEEAIESIRASTPAAASTPITHLELDLASFASIKSAARTLLAASDRLDVLINNAGIMNVPEGLTADGYEVQFGTNHVGPALLTQLLLPRLKRTAALPGSGDVRVVFLSSALERSAESGLLSTPDKLKTTMPETGTQSRYANSKLANIHYAWALAEQNPDLKVVSVHPGVVQTGLLSTWKDGFNPIVKGAINLAGRALMTTIEKGAYNQLWAATAAEGVETGTFYWPVGVKGKGTKASKDVKQRDALWAWTQKELNGHLFV
ncbi:dehydrogenase/reductase SDR family member 13 [Pyricularia oryzae 70-15]|uniref:Dehydrogenase/reductase SDR family member 13 n=3 Tax=Pyricularia oryzae TaxID=318829 RepID=G4MWE6_PYRO7|nr:dehydrogenase/reductase SDR family member 13 [Pyricularia oryzae 70-15]EHA55906.1 dehydrogenase/reductase SDR family member 13 [Pyricularia oryzae 70-15]ELQ43518.1 dehydrogenase/reductase SDR family member 13 [Pyricularia oryzae Y34]KAI7917842.1 dehydrogenase/reductase SDR family member 13 [Pyricularia oryzae]KAI7918269.1 dehydrogenase/reductase SDR family member 13 [Pyricularia oryzae]